jgi:hypothetical protein
MKLFELSIALDVVVLLYFGVWVWVLVRRRDLWLRYTAAEAAFFSRLHLPHSFVTASRRFSEGRSVIYFAVVGLVAGLLLLMLSVGMCIYFKEKGHDRLPPEKQDAQVVDNQINVAVLFLESLPPAGRGWSANKSLI